MLTSCCQGSGAGLALLPGASHPHVSPREAGSPLSPSGAREGAERGKDFFLWPLDSGQRQRGSIRETKRRGNKDMEEKRGQKEREHTPNESFHVFKKKGGGDHIIYIILEHTISAHLAHPQNCDTTTSNSKIFSSSQKETPNLLRGAPGNHWFAFYPCGFLILDISSLCNYALCGPL